MKYVLLIFLFFDYLFYVIKDLIYAATWKMFYQQFKVLKAILYKLHLDTVREVLFHTNCCDKNNFA